MATITLPQRRTSTRLLVDPQLPAEFLGAAPVEPCPDRRALLARVTKGSVVVLCDPQPEAVRSVVARGADVVAVLVGAAGGDDWLQAVVEAGAIGAMVAPAPEALARLLAVMVRGADLPAAA